MNDLQNELSAVGRSILSGAVAGNGRVSYSTTQRGFCVEAGGKSPLHDGPRDPRLEATYRSAIDELVGLGLLEPNGVDHYLVASAGYKYAENASSGIGVRTHW